MNQVKAPFYTENQLKKIIKTGDDRLRWGQNNRKIDREELPPKWTPKPKSHTSRTVWSISEDLEITKLENMGDPEEWHRLHEIQKLSREQVKDDMEHPSAMRVGRNRVLSLDVLDESQEGLYQSKSPDQEAMSAAMDEYVKMLTDAQREAVQLKFYTNQQLKYSLAELGISKISFQKGRIKPALEKLRKFLVEDFKEEVTSEGS